MVLQVQQKHLKNLSTLLSLTVFAEGLNRRQIHLIRKEVSI